MRIATLTARHLHDTDSPKGAFCDGRAFREAPPGHGECRGQGTAARKAWRGRDGVEGLAMMRHDIEAARLSPQLLAGGMRVLGA
jgi:hypothetical protein